MKKMNGIGMSSVMHESGIGRKGDDKAEVERAALPQCVGEESKSVGTVAQDSVYSRTQDSAHIRTIDRGCRGTPGLCGGGESAAKGAAGILGETDVDGENDVEDARGDLPCALWMDVDGRPAGRGRTVGREGAQRAACLISGALAWEDVVKAGCSAPPTTHRVFPARCYIMHGGWSPRDGAETRFPSSIKPLVNGFSRGGQSRLSSTGEHPAVNGRPS
ncbi:hypothetical protein C8J57DRAFT_1227048 [Mycena rebaudengoi]|nr:hypothetical protein C8J57DRAFT_1227048 [Mycena rebaudengoi]